MNGRTTEFGFKFGPADVKRCAANDRRGWIVLTLDTALKSKHGHIQIYVTKTGRIRIFSQVKPGVILDGNGEWKKPK